MDQIRLWELERDRLFHQEGCLYEQFTKITDFEMVRDYAKVTLIATFTLTLSVFDRFLYYFNNVEIQSFFDNT